jgi:glycosyltransferase involved in cell wall biosynthesis
MTMAPANGPAERTARSGDCGVVVFTRNEDGLAECIESILASDGSFISRITVIVNGSSGSFVQEARRLKARYGDILRVFEIPLGDKSHAWNQYVYGVNEKHAFHAFVDAYVRVRPNAIRLLVQALEGNARAVAATGVPSMGRQARALAAEMNLRGGLHGSLHVLRGTFIERIRAAGIRLPIGLYRGDGLIGSMAMHDLAPLETPFDKALIEVVGDATWEFNPLNPLNLADMKRYWRRRIRQARGRYENAYLKTIIYTGGYNSLPVHLDPPLLEFTSHASVKPRSAEEAFFMWLARREISTAIPSEETLQIHEI